MDTIFYIAYEFPPLNNGGVLRSAKFAKYLPEFNVKPVVFTLSPESYPNVFEHFLLEDKLYYDLPKETKVIHVPTSGPSHKSVLKRYFSIVRRDTSHWQPALENAIINSIDIYLPKAIIVTAPPFSLVTFARKMARRLKLPLIIDMRDAWTYWNLSPYRTYFHYWFTKREEYRCFNQAAAVIATSSQTIQDFQRLHPSISKQKFHLITNGFDEDLHEWREARKIRDKKFKIGYVGSFYYSPSARAQMLNRRFRKKIPQWFNYVPRKEDWLYRSPNFFFKAVQHLLAEYPDLHNVLEIYFAGHKPDWFDDMADEYQLSSITHHLGTLSLQESSKLQQSCDALLLTSAKVIGGNDYSIAGKTFEYLAMKKPILAFVCTGAQKDILDKMGVAIVCDPDQPVDSSEKILALIQGKLKLNPNQQLLKSFHRKKLSSDFAEVIKNVE